MYFSVNFLFKDIFLFSIIQHVLRSIVTGIFFHITLNLSQLINETKIEYPAEPENYRIVSGSYLSPAKHPSKNDIFVGTQSLWDHHATTKTLLGVPQLEQLISQ